VSPENARKTGILTGIPELSGSIARIGLIHPVILMKEMKTEKKDGKQLLVETGRFELIAGQRRLAAVQDLGWKTIPALISDKPLDELGQLLVSFGENTHRRKLPYSDTIRVTNKLFKAYEGSTVQKISQIAKDLGLAKNTVTRYLSYQLVPPEVRRMVEEERISAKKAYDITSAYWPNKERIIAIANLVDQLTDAEFDRAVDIGLRNPKAPINEVVTEAKKTPTVVTFLITVPIKIMSQVEKAAKQRATDVHGLILTAIETYLSEDA
jgi:ParB/RepB/Spo0J family partition protein